MKSAADPWLVPASLGGPGVVAVHKDFFFQVLARRVLILPFPPKREEC